MTPEAFSAPDNLEKTAGGGRVPAIHPDDVVLWPDGFWCYRKDFPGALLRDNNYRVISRYTLEWLGRTGQPLLAAAPE